MRMIDIFILIIYTYIYNIDQMPVIFARNVSFIFTSFWYTGICLYTCTSHVEFLIDNIVVYKKKYFLVNVIFRFEID